MDPNMDPKFYQMNGMNPNMVPGGMPNGMRPPSSHPGGFGNQIAQQQMAMAARQGQNWQAGPNSQMVQQPNQGGPQQNMGTPRQGAMPPPSAPAANANANGRTNPSSPQQGTAAPPTPSQTNKAAPKKKNETKGEKTKVYSIALNVFFCRNVDIDDSGPTRINPPQISTLLVLHHPPTPQLMGRHRRPRLRSHPYMPIVSKRTSRTAPCNLLRTVNRLLRPLTLVSLHQIWVSI